MKKKAFISFEGADGVGKSTVIKLIIPRLVESHNFSGYLFFHWKPTKKEVFYNEIPTAIAHDPRSEKARSSLPSLLYLFYHWISFWIGYLKFVLPALFQRKLVVADRYTYDVWMDPQRFRLNVPRFLLKLFIFTLPQPDKIIGLHAPASIIRSRKPELTEKEIDLYQKKLIALPPHRLLLIEAKNTPIEITDAILNKLNAK